MTLPVERPKDLDARAESTTLAEECEALRIERGAVSVGALEEEVRDRLSFDESILHARWAKVLEGRIAELLRSARYSVSLYPEVHIYWDADDLRGEG